MLCKLHIAHVYRSYAFTSKICREREQLQGMRLDRDRTEEKKGSWMDGGRRTSGDIYADIDKMSSQDRMEKDYWRLSRSDFRVRVEDYTLFSPHSMKLRLMNHYVLSKAHQGTGSSNASLNQHTIHMQTSLSLEESEMNTRGSLFREIITPSLRLLWREGLIPGIYQTQNPNPWTRDPIVGLGSILSSSHALSASWLPGHVS